VDRSPTTGVSGVRAAVSNDPIERVVSDGDASASVPVVVEFAISTRLAAYARTAAVATKVISAAVYTDGLNDRADEVLGAADSAGRLSEARASSLSALGLHGVPTSPPSAIAAGGESSVAVMSALSSAVAASALSSDPGGVTRVSVDTRLGPSKMQWPRVTGLAAAAGGPP
jgi:hypothetical protein